MTLKERLTEEMKQAMKAKEKGRLSAIRMVRAAIRDKEIEKRTELDMSHTSSMTLTGDTGAPRTLSDT
jgi:uncharacterized protein YqeY